MTLWHVFDSDAYEIVVDDEDYTIQSITIYREKRTVVGKSVELEDLPEKLQNEILYKVNAQTSPQHLSKD